MISGGENQARCRVLDVLIQFRYVYPLSLEKRRIA